MTSAGNALTRAKKQKAIALLQADRPLEAKPLLEQICRTDRRDAEAHLALATAYLALGVAEEAERYGRQALTIRPDYAEAHYLLGNLHAEQDPDAAATHYRRALESSPHFVEAHCNFGALLERRGDLSAAAEQYRQAIRLRPEDAGLHYNLGNALQAQHRLAEAVESYRHALRLEPAYAAAWNNLGLALARQGSLEEAIECCQRAVRYQPGNAEAFSNLGNLFAERDGLDQAVEHYRRALEIRPDHAQTHNNLGSALQRLGRLDEAVACYTRALSCAPDFAEAHTNLANTYTKLWRHDDALKHHRRALELEPRNPQSWCNLGFTHIARGDFPEGMSCLRRAVELDPDDPEAHSNLAFWCLATGHFEQGWNEYRWHWRRKGEPARPVAHPSRPLPADLSGKTVLLYHEQGPGDELFFLRFAGLLRARGARVTYVPTSKIAPLLARVPLISALGSPPEIGRADYACCVGDLPELLGMHTVGQIPPAVALSPLSEKLETMRATLQRLGHGPFVGVTWRAGVRLRTLYKEAPPARIAHVLRDLPATVVVLQRHPQPGEVEAFAQALGRPAHDLSALNDDLEQMLALLSLIDDYVGVSNTNMHLRAGVGKTARVLVPAPPEWRWMAEGKESPWFPGFTLYRQGYDGSWEGALGELRQDLQRAFRR